MMKPHAADCILNRVPLLPAEACDCGVMFDPERMRLILSLAASHIMDARLALAKGDVGEAVCLTGYVRTLMGFTQGWRAK